MRKIRALIVSLCVLSLLLPTAAFAANNEDSAKKQFCAVKEFMVKNKAFSNTFMAVATTVDLTGAILASMVRYETERKMLSKGMKSTNIALKASRPAFVGPLKAFVSAMLPFMDKSAKLIDEAKLSSKTAIFYKKVYTPAYYIVAAARVGYYGVQTAGVAVCKKGTFLGVAIKRKQATNAGKKFVAVAKKYKSRIDAILKRCNAAKSAIMPMSGTFRTLKKVLTPIKKPIQGLEKGIKTLNKGMKPIFSLTNKLIKELKRKRCITYGVKVKAKVKIKAKVWKSKVKVKTKKIKFCFKFYSLVRTFDKLSNVVEKPVKGIFNKAIKPLVKKIMKQVKKGLKLGKLKKFEKKFSSIQRKLKSFGDKLKSAKALKTDINTLKNMNSELSRIRP